MNPHTTASVGTVAGRTAPSSLGHRRVSVVSDLASGATVGLIPLLHGLGLLPF